jgi:hypothetical protein
VARAEPSHDEGQGEELGVGERRELHVGGARYTNRALGVD